MFAFFIPHVASSLAIGLCGLVVLVGCGVVADASVVVMVVMVIVVVVVGMGICSLLRYWLYVSPR